jgi:hypothetical protein
MYAKLFASMYQGTLRGRSDELLVFTNLLAHTDSNGVVDKHWRAIAEETGLSRKRVEAAILNLESPDSESRSPEMQGRRIVRLDEHRAWGWSVVNHAKYRAIRNEDDRREQNRLAQERWRNKHSNQNKPRKPPQAQSESEADTDTEKNLMPNGIVTSATLDDVMKAFGLFNDSTKRTGWPAVQKIDDDRRKAMRGRLKECGGIEGFAIALGKAEASHFLTEKWPNFNLDWMLKPKNFRKLMEGNYDDRNHADPDERSITAGLAGLAEAGSRR